ncbi:MAG: PD-(D/E)XK nuclease family protein [Cellvibrionaceae bacterium]|nr:PD-(D/E)XK nuclease family protein [Cellvibrionaceae bacterium]
MLPPLFHIDTIIHACRHRQLVLTANQRLCHKALQAWGQYLSEQGQATAVAPRIFSLRQWLDHCWQQLQGKAYGPSKITLASREQERVLWEQVTANCGRMQPEILAKQAASALRSLHLWELPLHCLDDYICTDRSDTEAASGIELYRDWCQQFTALMDKHRLISREQSYQIIRQAFDEQILASEDGISLLGFDDIPPLINTLLHKATPQCSKLNNHDFQPASLVQRRYRDTETELTAVAHWAKDILRQQQAVRIGIIVPNLGQCRQAVELALTKVFEGHSLLASTARYSLPFNISAGTPLGNTPLIADTLALLNLQKNHWPLEQLVQLLFSPFWGNRRQELAQRAALANHLEAQGKFFINGSELRYWAQTLDDQQTSATGLYRYLQAFNTKVDKTRRYPSLWVDNFLAALDCLDWPGERRADSIEYQQTQAWYQLLEQFASLDSTLGKISGTQAVNELQAMAKRTPFQAQVTDSPIQVLGILEGVGLHFSHCWVLGLDQYTWPPAPAPNPLLPLQLQRQHQLPHATHERELAYAQSLTAHYRHCATEIVFSSPQTQSDTQLPRQPSQLIADIPLVSATAIAGDKNAAQTAFDAYLSALFHSRRWTLVDCAQGPAYTHQAGADHRLDGGAAVIKAQAANPFDAFAIYRLGARQALPIVPGFSAIEQGTILHQALAEIWRHLQDQATLLATADTQLHDWVQAAVTTQVQLLKKRKREHLQDTLCALEINRQTQLLCNWLDYEKQRPPFRVIAVEQERHLRLGNTVIAVRIDRIDQLADGSVLIVDYKSGDARTSAWKGERPADPQLPLYLFACQHAVAGIAFAQISARELRFKGLHNGEVDIDDIDAIGDNRLGLPTHWAAVEEHWQAVLQQLLQAYTRGYCPVDYRSSASINPQLLPLNRYWEGPLIADWLRQQDDRH